MQSIFCLSLKFGLYIGFKTELFIYIYVDYNLENYKFDYYLRNDY